MAIQTRKNMVNPICICCNNTNWGLIENTDGGDYLSCKHCGYQIQTRYSSDTRNQQFEEEQNKFYDEESICLSPLFLSLQEEASLRRIELIQKFLTKGSLIEVGPGSGDVMSLLLSKGYNVEAIEHSDVLAKNIKDRLGVKVRVGAFEDEDFNDTLYDAYMSFHVIEHVTDVMTHLEKANSIVKKGGYAFIATPNAGSWEHKLPFALSPNFSTAHFQLFSAKSLAHCLEKTGWEIKAITTPSYSSSWLRVVTSIIRRAKGKDDSAPRGEYIKSSSTKLEKAVKTFNFITSPFNIFQEKLKYGDELFIVAVKTQ